MAAEGGKCNSPGQRGPGQVSKLIQSAESAVYFDGTNVLEVFVGKGRHISRLQRFNDLHPARWAGLLHLAPSAQFH